MPADPYVTPRTGRYRKRITIEQISTAPTGDGGTASTWSTFASAWASLDPIGGGEAYVGDGVSAQQQSNMFQIKMLYQPGINASMRANYQGRYFHFISVNDVGELHRDLVITAQEITNPV